MNPWRINASERAAARIAAVCLVLCMQARAGVIPVEIGAAQVELNGPWSFNSGDDPRWSQPQFDDSRWSMIDLRPALGARDADVGLTRYVPGWSTQGHPGLSGYAWYRLHIRVNASPDTRIGLLAPTQVEDAYQIFWNGVQIGGSGDFSGARPLATSTKPRLLALPALDANSPEAVIAIRVWMQPGLDRAADAGGVHNPPSVGEWSALEASYRLQWLESIRGYLVDVIEPVGFLLLAALSLLFLRAPRQRALGGWICAALLLTAALRLNQALYFWFDLETQSEFLFLKYAVLEPSSLGAWLLAWLYWLRVPVAAPLRWTILAGVVTTLLAVSSDTAPWLREGLRTAAAAALVATLVIAVRRSRPDRLLTSLCILLLVTGLFAEELTALGVPGIWFPFGTGVSRTQFAYAGFICALGALMLRSLIGSTDNQERVPQSSKADSPSRWPGRSSLLLIIGLSAALAADRAASATLVPGNLSARTRIWTPPALSTDQFESSPTFTPQGDEVYFFRADREFDNYRLMQSNCGKHGWSRPEPPSFAARGEVAEADPSITADGKRLYYVSTRPRDTQATDDFDIWYVDRLPEGGWSEPHHLPEPINSPYAELLPRPLPDGRLLFGSNRPGGYGRGDIYIATPQDGQWRVENLGPPVNTAANELEAEISRDGSLLIVVANRDVRWHLYAYENRGNGWRERGRLPLEESVFQVGPLLSPKADRLLFAQSVGELSGEILQLDLTDNPDSQWPPRCPRNQPTGAAPAQPAGAAAFTKAPSR